MVVDVSGSMYRFNGHDGRLDRMLESVLMVMEAFTERHSKKFKVRNIFFHIFKIPTISINHKELIIGRALLQ